MITLSSTAIHWQNILNADIDDAFKMYALIYGSTSSISIMERNAVDIETALEKSKFARSFVVKNLVEIENLRAKVAGYVIKNHINGIVFCADYARALHDDNIVYKRVSDFCEKYAGSLATQQKQAEG